MTPNPVTTRVLAHVLLELPASSVVTEPISGVRTRFRDVCVFIGRAEAIGQVDPRGRAALDALLELERPMLGGRGQLSFRTSLLMALGEVACELARRNLGPVEVEEVAA